MPTTLPVPSTGALRALRKLALGTSCTIAFGAGLLTEDRRCRIHYVREVHENAKKLKSFRKYHNASTSSKEAQEDQTLRHRDEASWLPSNVSKSTASVAPGSTSTVDPPRVESPVEREESNKASEAPKPTSRQIKNTRFLPSNDHPPLRSPASRLVEHPEQQSHKAHTYQRQIAADLTKLLEQDPPDVETAAQMFFEASEDEFLLEKSGLLQELIDASAELSRACQRMSMFTNSSRILDIVLSHGHISEEDFNAFQPLGIIKRLIPENSCRLDSDKLQKASSIYLTQFKEKPKAITGELRSMGARLCQATCRKNLLDLSLALFSRLENCRDGQPPIAVDYLLKATHLKGHHQKMFRHFQNLYSLTSPNQGLFFQSTGLVLDSMLILGRLDKAEQVLKTASQMAEAGALITSTTWFLRVLGEEYRIHRDLVRLQNLFRRLQPLSLHTHHPQALYGAVIQCCIEAREEQLATSYYRELRTSYDRRPEDLRIYCHFALGKAYRGDWDGVKADFYEMKAAVPEADEIYSTCFTPILKEYTKSHSVSEIEDFLQYFIVNFHLQTTTYIINAMIDVYSKVHEVDAISRWVSYATADGCAVDSKTFNAILRNCVTEFQFSFNESYRLYWTVRHLRADLVDNDSITILRGVAMSRSPRESSIIQRLERLDRLQYPVQVPGSNEIYRKMTTYSAENDDIAVLKTYKGAERDHVRLQPEHLALAVRACLRLHRDVDPVARLIRDAQGNSIDINNAVAAVFIHQMSDLYESGRDIDRLRELAEKTISSFAAMKVKVPQKAITHAASILQRQAGGRMTIDFWDSMSRRLNIPTSKFDVATLTTLLQSYIGLGDGEGVRWVVKVLLANNLPPDSQLKGTLKEARRKAGKQLARDSYSQLLHEWLDILDDALQEVKEMRLRAFRNKKQVSIKAVRIMQTAIEDQTLHTGSAEELPEGQGHIRQTESNWTDFDTRSYPAYKSLSGLWSA